MTKYSITLSGFVLAIGLAAVGVGSSGCAGTSSSRSTGAYIDDKSISTRVKTALFKDPAVSGFDVHVNTFRGDVQLSGFVDNPEQRTRAAEIARGVEGVQTVTNNLEVKTATPAVGTPGTPIQGSTQSFAQPPPDNAPAALGSTITTPPAYGYSGPNKLPAYTNNVEISSSNGRATLRGSVANESEKRNIEKKVRDIPGIQSVDNELQVLSPH